MEGKSLRSPKPERGQITALEATGSCRAGCTAGSRGRARSKKTLRRKSAAQSSTRQDRPPRSKSPGEEPIEKNWHRREEQDEQKRTNARMGRQGEESRTSPRERRKSRTPLSQIARGGCRKEAADKFDPHNKEGTQEVKATQRKTPKALLGSDRKGQETETLVGQGVQHKAGTVVVSDRANKSTLVKLLGMDAMVVVMAQEHLAKIIRQNTNRGKGQRTPLFNDEGTMFLQGAFIQFGHSCCYGSCGIRG